MTFLKCIAVDDEPWALALITDYIKKCPFLELIFESNSAIETLQYLQTASADLIFLDMTNARFNRHAVNENYEQ